jgi:hypothetical protein
MISTLGIGWAGELHAKNQQQVPHRAFSPVRNDKVPWGAHNCAQQYESSDSELSATFGARFLGSPTRKTRN